MENFLILLLIVVSLGMMAVLVVVVQKLRGLERQSGEDQGMVMLHQSIQSMGERLDRSQATIGTRLDHASRLFGDVSKELGHLQELGTHMRDLQDFLRSPKLRGNIGEMVLRDLLGQCFSAEQFSMQYKFKEGQMVDAIIKTDHGLIPIDAKFPFENFLRMVKCENEEERQTYRREFLRDIKKHINDISKKYVLPGEGTVDFALMYVPNETVYYELIRSEDDVNGYAVQQKVFPVSPNSFYYFMRIILMGMEGRRVEESAKKILGTLMAIQKESEKFGEDLGVLNTHITNTRTAYDRAFSHFAKLSGKLENVKLLSDDPEDGDENP